MHESVLIENDRKFNTNWLKKSIIQHTLLKNTEIELILGILGS